MSLTLSKLPRCKEIQSLSKLTRECYEDKHDDPLILTDISVGAKVCPVLNTDGVVTTMDIIMLM